MSFELSCADFTFHILPHEQALGLIADLGIAYVDLVFFSGCKHVQADEVLTKPTKTAAKIRDRVQAAGLRVADTLAVWGPYHYLSPTDPDPKSRAQGRNHFERLLEFAHGVGAKGITTIPGIPWPGQSRESALARAGEEMAWRVEHARAAGLRCSFEPHVESITENVADTLRLTELAPGLTVTLDYSHFVYFGIPQSDIERLHPVTGHLHGRQGGPGLLQASAREGAIDFARVVRLFVEQGFDGFFCLEYCCDPYLNMDRVDTLTETVHLQNLFLQVRDGLPPPADESYPWDMQKKST